MSAHRPNSGRESPLRRGVILRARSAGSIVGVGIDSHKSVAPHRRELAVAIQVRRHITSSPGARCHAARTGQPGRHSSRQGRDRPGRAATRSKRRRSALVSQPRISGSQAGLPFLLTGFGDFDLDAAGRARSCLTPSPGAAPRLRLVGGAIDSRSSPAQADLGVKPLVRRAGRLPSRLRPSGGMRGA